MKLAHLHMTELDDSLNQLQQLEHAAEGQYWTQSSYTSLDDPKCLATNPHHTPRPRHVDDGKPHHSASSAGAAVSLAAAWECPAAGPLHMPAAQSFLPSQTSQSPANTRHWRAYFPSEPLWIVGYLKCWQWPLGLRRPYICCMPIQNSTVSMYLHTASHVLRSLLHFKHFCRICTNIYRVGKLAIALTTYTTFKKQPH